jgi:hypoxanthine phosphoribosyltransferase
VAAEISANYRGKTLKLVGVLKGSIFFLTALARYIDVPLKIDFLGISSFSNKSGAPGVVRIAKDLDESIENEDVLLVEDIVDTGFTLRYLLQTLGGKGAQLAFGMHLPRPQLAAHRAGAGGLPLFRDPRPVRGGIRPGS